MVLKKTDFGKGGKSSQTPCEGRLHASNGFLTFWGLVLEDSVRIAKGPKSADFEQKPWTMASRRPILVGAGNRF